MIDETALVPMERRPLIFRIRGVELILDSDLAAALGLETKRLNERIARNADLVDDRHCFQLSSEEFASLRSQVATSSQERGGRRYPPWVFTQRGVARVTTFVNTPEAIRAADLIIDTFLLVQQQAASGRRQVTIDQPSRYHLGDEIAEQSQKLRTKLLGALDRLLDTVIDIRTHQTVAATAKDLTASALEHLRERLREKGLENLKLEAETRKILAEAEKIAADVRRTDAEVEGIHLDNLTKRIAMVRQLIDLQRELGPNQLVQLLDHFESGAPLELDADETKAPGRLPAPRREDD